MALNHSPQVVTNGLVYYHDMSNTQKSWKGAPTTNLYTDGDYSSQTLHPVRSGTWAFVDDPRDSTKKVLKATPSASTQYHGRDIASVVSTLYSLQMQIYVSPDFNGTLVSMYPEQGGTGAARYYDLTKKGTWQSLKYDGISASTTNIRMLAYVLSAFTTGYVLISSTGVEQNAFATPFVNGTRSNTQAITDLVGGNTITPSSLTYNSNGTFSFNGTSDEALINYTSSLSQFTVEIWAYPTGWSGLEPCAIADSYPGSTSKVNYMIEMLNASTWRAGTYQAGWYYSPTVTATLNVWQHVVYSFDGTNQTIYLNGVSGGSTTTYSGIPGSSAVGVKLGRRWDSANFFQGQLGVSKIYNRALSAAEILQNFNALKGRYGL